MSERKLYTTVAAGIGALATAALAGCLYVAHQIVPAIPFPAFAITDLIIRLAPGPVATAGIEHLGAWARPILRWVGVFIMIAAGAGLTALAVSLRPRPTFRTRTIGLAACALVLTIVVQAAVGPEFLHEPAAWTALLLGYVAWGTIAVWATDRATRDGAPVPKITAETQRTQRKSKKLCPSAVRFSFTVTPAVARASVHSRTNAERDRRRFLIGFAATALGLAAGGFALGRRLRPTPPLVALADLRPTVMALPQTDTPTAFTATPPADATSAPTATPSTTPVLSPPAATPAAPSADFVPATGTRPNITPLADFFVVNVGAEYPHIDLARWRLEVKGLVERPLALTFEELLALPRVDIYGTLECISNEVSGRLIGTTLFSAARMADVLRLASPRPEATTVVMRAADRYDESLPLSSALHEDTLLVYGMDGKILMPEHGYPLRVYNANHYGMKGPKWLTSLELTAEPHTGYWARLGWDQEAIVKTKSVIDGAGAIRVENGVARIGGIAFAGSRGIQEVGVQINGGAFRPTILDRPLSRLTWVRWRYDWHNPSPGEYRIVVRAIDGDGEEQTAQPAPPHPDGASGRHKILITIG